MPEPARNPDLDETAAAQGAERATAPASPEMHDALTAAIAERRRDARLMKHLKAIRHQYAETFEILADS